MIRPTAMEIESWREEIAALQERTEVDQPAANTIAFYGSSSIRLWETLQQDLQPFPVCNLGFGGSSYYWCNYFFENAFKKIQTSHILLYAGDNDLGNDQPLSFIMENVEQLLDKIRIRFGNIPVSVISVKPSPERLYLQDKILELNKELAAAAQKRQKGYFLDIHSQMMDENQQVRPALYEADQLHMNERGYEIWKAIIFDHLQQIHQS